MGGSEFDNNIQRIEFGWWRIGAWEFRSPFEYLGQGDYGATRIKWRGWTERDFAMVA
jgi:hypothetical protein